MCYADFETSPAGHLVPTLYNKRAFVPHPLPPQLDLGRIAVSLSKAMQAIGELKGACRRLSNPYILIRPLQRSEALTSSAMEGTFTTDEELLLADSGLQTRQSDETREVNNYIRALSAALHAVHDEPITNRRLREAHETLLSGLSGPRGANKLPGQFKRDQNMIGGLTLQTARFIPPPPQQTLDCMSDLERFINEPDGQNSTPLIDIGLAHYQFETIHPFADGNGRVGRMLISLMAVKSGLLDAPTLYLSPVIEGRKDEYIDLMYDVSSQGAWENWLRFFFEVVSESCTVTIVTIDRLLKLQEDYRRLVAETVRSANAMALIDMLFETPVVTAKDVAERLNLTDPGARRLLARFCDMDLLFEYTGVYPRAYLAHGIVDATRIRTVTPPVRPSAF
jgi:Fic family protein